MSIDETMESPVLQDFLKVATDFCSFIETNKSNPKKFIELAQGHFLSLYQSAKGLREIRLHHDIDFQDLLSEADFQKTFRFIADRLENYRYYWIILNPTSLNEYKQGCGDLLDDLGDIYKDLKPALLLYYSDNDFAQENASWQLWFDFKHHWGNHCADALYAIHHFLQQDENDSSNMIESFR